MSIEGYLDCYRITSFKTISISPRSEVKTPGKVCLPEGASLPACDIMIEEICKEIMRENAVTARTVVFPQEIVQVRLMNVSEESKLLPQVQSLES